MEHSRFNLSRWALEHQPLTRFLLVALLFGGIFAYTKLGQDEDPPFTFRAMVVQAFWPGATAEQMSRQVTDKIEKALQEVPYAWKIRSYSKPGETLVTFQLADTSPAKETPQLWYTVRKKVGDIASSLPTGVRGPYFNDDFGDVYGSIYALSADGFTYRQLNDYADAIRQQLLRVPNVAKVTLLGDQDEKIYIEFQQAKFAQMGLDINSIANQIAQQNNIGPSGVLVTPTDNVQIRLSGQFSDIRDLENLTLRGPGGTTNIRLGDIATVRHGYIDPPHAKMRFNGKEVIGLGISMAKGGDIIQLGKDLRATVEHIRTKLPVGIEMAQVQDQPQSVQHSVGEFVHVLIEAVVIVLGVSFLSLGLHTKPRLRIDVWPGLVVGLTIPLVLAVTFLFMNIFDIGLHKISLGALIIALGLLVDDAIIAVEMMVRKLEEGFSKMEAATFAYTSTAMPMLTGTLITATGFLPVGLARSTVGEYTFGIFAVTALALVLSWVAAVVFVPYLGYLLLHTKSHAGDGGHHELFDTPFYNRFRGWVNWCVEYRKTVIVITLVAFVLGVFGFKYVEKQFFPDSSRPELMVELWLPEGASFSQTEAEAKRFEALMRQQKNVESVAFFIGSGAPRFYLPLDQILPQTNVAQAIVMPTSLETREGVRQAIIGLLQSQFPHLRGRVKLLPNGPPVPYPVQFRVMGPDIGGVRKIADQVKAIMQANPNTVGVNDNWNENVKVLRLDIDQDKARALGVTTGSIAQVTQTVMSGAPIAQYRDGDKLLDIVMRPRESERNTLDALQNVQVPTAGGRVVPLTQVARVGFAWEPGVIWRENRDYGITVQSDVVDGVQGPTVTAQINPLLDKIRADLPPDYQIKIAGAEEESANAGASIAAQMPLCIFIIFTLLMLQLHSFSRAVMVFLTGPLGLIGAAATLLLLHAPMGFVAQLGITALIGMIIRNSVILVDQIEQDVATGVPTWNAIVEAAVRRFRPIILTAAAAVLAMIPLSRSVFWGPMAAAIMGGLIVATVLTLLFLPALYAAWFRVKRPEAEAIAPTA
ncbi:efflux RND transporter permease subunit [Ralstonia solanacearum]|uniref:Cobalt-zinc-cadmium resistance protein czca (Cation efflux system protein czca) n=2 Tax=Ralstonia solanacearum TaxID=305 RepID=F6G1G8_RALS8|nr:efflux RND transporter permease subunit [Ralstonia solanacearum]AEG69038.1 cobalt-zinc-cadmium resistance protein czca (cation efflux system protein czca) [Ralstonia solanacearum Po82]AMP70618.1 multidrug transporter AcrB [Ralstonia solanacearum]AMP72897.1 multidrug transporter AcrB [Ralstonia solanacearum]AYB60604.1 AcrB/AcrD/AcrF family protein [Ralstonia solanacearum]MBB6587865.1 efflux RND transporter permease subunit [Ralstonia solanacearum]